MDSFADPPVGIHWSKSHVYSPTTRHVYTPLSNQLKYIFNFESASRHFRHALCNFVKVRWQLYCCVSGPHIPDSVPLHLRAAQHHLLARLQRHLHVHQEQWLTLSRWQQLLQVVWPNWMDWKFLLVITKLTIYEGHHLWRTRRAAATAAFIRMI